MTRDPYRYFRIEAREHIDALASGVLALEKGGGDAQLVNALLRHAHTLKGAARVVRQVEISKLSHALEEMLGAIRDDHAPVDREMINRLLQTIDAIADHAKSLDEPVGHREADATSAKDGGPRPESTAASLDTIRVALTELDPLLYGIWELGIHLRALREQLVATDQMVMAAGTSVRGGAMGAALRGEVGGNAAMAVLDTLTANPATSSLQEYHRRLLTLMDKAEREVMQLQDRTTQLRLLPASSLFASLERTARDAADALGKQVDFRACGGDNRLDAHVLRGVNDALLHLIRNAVSHGIESPGDRAAAGKPPAGRVEIEVARSNNRLAFTCRDDGRGIDPKRVQDAAAARGLAPAGQNATLTCEQAIELLLRGGITTAETVTEHAGRGIGLDVVRETVTRLEGAVEMQSTPSDGTIVRMIVPVSLEAMPILEVEVAGHRACLPFGSVRRVLQISEADIAHTAEGDSILFDGAPLPLLSLQALLFPGMSPQARSTGSRTIVIEGNHKRAAVSVDQICGRRTVVLKPLPAVVEKIEAILGACFDASGDPMMVLDPGSLVESARKAPQASTPVSRQVRPHVLVIDDSLTTRMLEQSILETAGYDVDLAVSAEEGLIKAKLKPYAVFIVDVEMPGMNGYEFIATVKADTELRATPAILVTSRGTPEDRARGEAVGAAAYIVKSEFEENVFLTTIRRLLGS